MVHLNYILTVTIICLSATSAMTQGDSTKLEITGYIDSYYATFSNDLEANQLQPYTTVSPRDNRFGLNVIQLGATYQSDLLRGALTIHYGDIAEATWSEEFRAVQEAWAGFQIVEGLWLDGGFFATHIGTESFLPKNNFLSSTAVATFNEPFFQSGARLSYEKHESFTAQLHVVSGYNFFLDVNDAKSVGVYISYQIDKTLSMTYTNLYGRESLDGAPIEQNRFYHNLYVNWDPVQQLSVIVGGDLGTQTNSELDDPDETAMMYNALATVRYRFSDKLSSTGRFEVFNDRHGFISGTLQNNEDELHGLQLTGWTLGMEYAPASNAYIRAETRWIRADEDLDIFLNDDGATRNRTEFMVNMGFYFHKKIK